MLHSPRYPGGSSCGAHAVWSSLWVSILSTIRIIRFAMVFNTCTSLFWKMFLYLISSFTQGVSLHSSIMCFWVSGEFLQYLQVVFFWNLFFCSISQVALMFWFLWWHYIPFCWAFPGIPAFCWWIGFRCFPTSALFLFCFELLLGSSFWSFPLFVCLCYFSFHFFNTLLFDLLPWIPPGFHWFFPSRCCFRAVSFF